MGWLRPTSFTVFTGMTREEQDFKNDLIKSSDIFTQS